MKKLILGMVFVFATGTMMNASSSIEKEVLVENSECDDVYFAVRDQVTSMTGSEYIGIAAAIAAENACMDEEIEIID